nr:unknown [Vitreoscilla sp. C1]
MAIHRHCLSWVPKVAVFAGCPTNHTPKSMPKPNKGCNRHRVNGFPHVGLVGLSAVHANQPYDCHNPIPHWWVLLCIWSSDGMSSRKAQKTASLQASIFVNRQ